MELSADRKRLLALLIGPRTSVPNDAGARVSPAQSAHTPDVSITPRVATWIAPVSFAQRRLWFLEQLQQDEVPYTLHVVQHLKFCVDPLCLERAIHEIVQRHDILRTTFVLQDEEPVQRIAATSTVPLRSVDLLHIPELDRRNEALRQMGLAVARRFELNSGPLLRTELYRLGEQESLLLLAVHHIVFDGPSFHVFFNELQAIYGSLIEGRPHSLPRPLAQYADVVKLQRERLTPERIADEVAFWRAELANTPMLDLPTDRRRAPVPTFRGRHTQVSIAPARVLGLRQRAAHEHTTLFTVLLAGLWAALARVCGQNDFAVGLPVTGRDSPEREHAIGFFVDTVVVRANLEDDPLNCELVRRAHAALQRSLSHGSLPFEMLVQHLQPERDLGINPFFQVGFQLMLRAATTDESGAPDIARSSAMFDLGIDLWLQGDGIEGRLQFNTDLFDTATIELIVAAIHSSLEWLTAPDCRLSDLTIGDTGGHVVAPSILQGDTLAYVECSCVEMIAQVAAEYPETIAITGQGASITYDEVMQRAAKLSQALLAHGATPGALIALDLRRSVDLTLMQLATWRARCTFVCTDPSWPQQRREQILSEVQPRLTVDDRVLSSLYQSLDSAPQPLWPEPGDLAYIVYTSGSSGQPKGVQVEHRGLLNTAQAQRAIFRLTPGRRVAQLASSAFDASIFETTLALCSGATLVVAPPDVIAGADLATFLSRERVDTIVIPPTLLATMEPSTCRSVRVVCVAGENCPADLAHRWRDGREFWNLYGPAEATIWATFGRRDIGAKLSIGRPIPNTSTVVVDRTMRSVPVGIAGELCIGGIGVARGYLDRAALTAERFTSQPQYGAQRLYLTGDLVRQTRDGELVFLGRIDRQIKIRGARVEPEEIEVLMRTHPLVQDALVSARSVGHDETVLVCHVQCRGNRSEALDACRRFASENLPQHLVPSRFVAVSDWPRTASGKIDVNALPMPDDESPTGNQFVEPSTPTERRVAELMAHGARVARVGATSDFFRIGGHSLSAAQLVARARAHFGIDLAIRDVFSYPTVSALSARIDTLVAQRLDVPEIEEVPLVRLPRRHEIR